MKRGAILSVILVSACSVPPETGKLLRVGPYGHSDGLAAKRAAEAVCGAMGKRLNPTGFGHFRAGGWEFAGGCQP